MTIKTPVRITYKANTRGFASYPHFVDADGYHVEFSALAAALNASTAAPDLTALREEVKARCRYQCSYCTRQGTVEKDPDGQAWHIEHVVPVACGGPTHAENLTLACSLLVLDMTSKRDV